MTRAGEKLYGDWERRLAEHSPTKARRIAARLALGAGAVILIYVAGRFTFLLS